MTYRTHAAHTTCPGCQEEVYLDELVKGRCPLCGCTLEDLEEIEEDDVEDVVDRADYPWLVFNYFLFKMLTDMGASPLKVMQLVSTYEEACLREGHDHVDTRFELDVEPGRIERYLPHRCDRCGRIFLGHGRKILSGDLSAPGFRVSFRCNSCR